MIDDLLKFCKNSHFVIDRLNKNEIFIYAIFLTSVSAERYARKMSTLKNTCEVITYFELKNLVNNGNTIFV